MEGNGRASAPISKTNLNDLRRLILRGLNDNQILLLSRVARDRRTITSHIRLISEEYKIPISTLKLNSRILREFNLISYGSGRRSCEAKLLPLGTFILKLLDSGEEENSN